MWVVFSALEHHSIVEFYEDIEEGARYDEESAVNNEEGAGDIKNVL